MNKILLIAITILILGCGDNDINYGVYTDDIATGTVRDYNTTNSSNRVNVLITIGQSNSVGVLGDRNITTSNVYVPNENAIDYPSTITFSEVTNNNINRRGYGGATNIATKYAEMYNDTVPLYIIHIAIGGTGVDFYSNNNLWSFNRADTDGNSLHPQLIHYMETVITTLQDEGREPYVIGLDYNQWESEAEDTVYGHYQTYSTLFDTIETVIPNDDYKLFICYPTATRWGNTETMQDTFLFIQETRDNVYIYRPLELGVTNIWFNDGHYNEATYQAMAEYIGERIN